MFSDNGNTLLARYYEDDVSNGYKLAYTALDAAGVNALAAMREIIEAPENWVECRLEAGVSIDIR